MERKTVFEVFGIENKETKVSNLFAYYIETSKEFLNLLCDLAKIDRVQADSILHVHRESRFTMDGYDNRNNYIDILVCVGDDDKNPQRIICIENKIYADEGYKQTERYQKGMEKEFPTAQRDYVFITKNNSFVNLSSIHFHQIRYMDLIEKVREDDRLFSLEYMKDFSEFYYEREHRTYLQMEEQNLVPDHDTFIDYYVWKANSDAGYCDLYVKSGTSDRNSNHRYLQISKQSWVIRNTGIYDEMSVHLEGNNEAMSLHFEAIPYTPLKKMPGETRQKYEALRNSLRNEVKGIAVEDVNVIAPSNRDKITLMKFEIDKTNDLKEALRKINEVVAAVDEKIQALLVKS